MTNAPLPDEPTPLPPAYVDIVPERTTPTWEMEILLSGATVFALFQLYGSVHEGVFWITERLPSDIAAGLMPLSLYLQGGLLALALGFLAHLALRAIWVSTIGLKSVDPEGRVRESPTLGPAQRELLAKRWEALPQAIASLDDHATLVFALSIGLARMMAVLFMLATFAAVVSGALWLAFGVPTPADGFVIVVAVVLAPMLLAAARDSVARRRGTPAPSWVRWMVRRYSTLGFTPDQNLSIHSFSFRLAGRSRFKTQAVTIALISALVGVALLVPLLQHRGLGGVLAGGFPRFQAGDALVLRSEHYLDRLRPDDAMRLPALPSERITGPYLPLFIPYVPEWHAKSLQACAPSVDGVRWQADPKASRDVLDCLAQAQPVRLDGRPIAASWTWSEDRRRDRRGFLLMIDARGLPPGPHWLEVEQPPAARADAAAREHPTAPWRIPFWL